ncbi:hypothetical protein EUX98_g9482 [Antrodiella citrinella]|uniref:DUF6533 domain-containing protein n=1 Tax=Antrodiella citrinella TaxID=2447956 RepID=A0A4S4LSG6_9APHY|nr:hypothetical protein EUX98_g9482 [Antrodiella citrinella]
MEAFPSYPEDFMNTRTTVYTGFASFTVLIWDHIVTFDDEVECIWTSKMGPVVWLFLLNRYMTPLGFIVNLIAYMRFMPGTLMHRTGS